MGVEKGNGPLGNTNGPCADDFIIWVRQDRTQGGFIWGHGRSGNRLVEMRGTGYVTSPTLLTEQRLNIILCQPRLPVIFFVLILWDSHTYWYKINWLSFFAAPFHLQVVYKMSFMVVSWFPYQLLTEHGAQLVVQYRASIWSQVLRSEPQPLNWETRTHPLSQETSQSLLNLTTTLIIAGCVNTDCTPSYMSLSFIQITSTVRYGHFCFICIFWAFLFGNMLLKILHLNL